MAKSTIYTRAYSDSSARQLTSGRGPTGYQLTHSQLLFEFKKHKELSNRQPTALVSVSNRLIDTLTRALKKHYDRDEHPSNIWVAFIEIPDDPEPESVRPHSALNLAEQCGEPNPELFSHEFLFEWAIPEEYVSHLVSLETLMGRWQGNPIMDAVLETPPSNTQELKETIAEQLGRVSDDCSPWAIGEVLGDFASTFGARAPLWRIVYRLFEDCLFSGFFVRSEFDMFHLKFSSHQRMDVHVDWYHDLEQGPTAVLEDWLERISFSADYDNFKKWEDAVEADMEGEEDMFLRWCDQLGLQFPKSRDKNRGELSAKHRENRAALEREAVRIGL
jgi:hypothetical protein